MIHFNHLDRPKLEGSPLNAQLSLVADALGNQDELPTRGDFEQAYQQLGLVESGEVSWQQLQTAIHKKYLNKNWIETDAPWAADLIPYIDDPTKNPKLYAASLMWLQDQLRALPLNIKVIPKLIDSDSSSGVVYTQAYEPRGWTKTAVVLPGDYAGPFHYSELGLWLATHNVRVITIDDACGAYSTQCPCVAGNEPGWGSFATDDPLKDYGAALHEALTGWDLLIDEFTKKKTFLVPHCGGVFKTLGYAKYYPDEANSLGGLVNIAPGYKMKWEITLGLGVLNLATNSKKAWHMMNWLQPNTLKKDGGTDPAAGLKFYYAYKAENTDTSNAFNDFRYQADSNRWWEDLATHQEGREIFTLPVSVIYALNDTRVEPVYCERLVPFVSGSQKIRLIPISPTRLSSDEGERDVANCKDRFEIHPKTGTTGHLMTSTQGVFEILLEEIRMQ